MHSTAYNFGFRRHARVIVRCKDLTLKVLWCGSGGEYRAAYFGGNCVANAAFLFLLYAHAVHMN